MTSTLCITRPEMTFGGNVEHLDSGWFIEFNSLDALDRVDKTGGSMLQLAHFKERKSTRYEGLTERACWEELERRSLRLSPELWSLLTGHTTPITKEQPSRAPVYLSLPSFQYRWSCPDPIVFFPPWLQAGTTCQYVSTCPQPNRVTGTTCPG